MDELMDTLMNDDISASDASEKIKDILFAKSAEKINTVKPDIASRLFDQDVDLDNPEGEESEEPSAETDVNLDQESEPEEEEDPETSVTQTPSIGGAVLTNPG